MGRQLPIVATPADERQLLEFVQSLSPIRVFVPFAKDVNSLWIDDWDHAKIDGFHFNIWLQSFVWEPEYKQTGGPRCPKERTGLWYVSNASSAPVIEVSRPLENGLSGGRVYWGSDFSAPNGLNYDASAFARVVDRIWKWVRRNGRRQLSENRPAGPYLLPDAWHQFSKSL